ncbi:hypothetical protein [Halioglobus sp. HI00S01]|uniref:hypothetical protein n=1 Tax=Halioglobus sp. HI00S01 TaxID=1822214 RepID=UPI0012E7545E|nr:hypothetical protein [Halioglobus sp. HI00S01]
MIGFPGCKLAASIVLVWLNSFYRDSSMVIWKANTGIIYTVVAGLRCLDDHRCDPIYEALLSKIETAPVREELDLYVSDFLFVASSIGGEPGTVDVESDFRESLIIITALLVLAGALANGERVALDIPGRDETVYSEDANTALRIARWIFLSSSDELKARSSSLFETFEHSAQAITAAILDEGRQFSNRPAPHIRKALAAYDSRPMKRAKGAL